MDNGKAAEAKITFLEKLIETASASDISDIHIRNEGSGGIVFRKARAVRPVRSIDLNGSWDELNQAMRSLSGLPNAEGPLPKRFGISYGELRIRVSRFTTGGGVLDNLSLRLQPKTARPLESTGLPPSIVKVLTDGSPGLVLVAGGSSAGKTSTVASAISYFNKDSDFHIRTLESPIEYVYPRSRALISQQQVETGGADDVDSYSEAIEDALTQDINVLMIGEIRGIEAIRAGLRAASLGLLVIGTVHGPDVSGTIQRMVEEFPPSDRAEAFASLQKCLKAIIVQRLDASSAKMQMRVQAAIFADTGLRDLITRESYMKISQELRKEHHRLQGSVDNLTLV